MDISVLLWSQSGYLPVLTLMTLIPLASMLFILLIDSSRLNNLIAFAGSGLSLLLASYLLLNYNVEVPGIQFAEHLVFAGLHYSVGVDGANILFIPLVAIISLLSLIYIQGSRYANDDAIIAALLGYETILIGAFSTLNALQFWFWCALEILPVAYLTYATGTGRNRKSAMTILIQFWSGGLFLSLLGFLLLGFGIQDPELQLNFDWLNLVQNDAPFMNETLIFILLFYGFAVRMPLFPFHAWLPYLAEQGSVVVGIVLIVGIKLGIYAFIRFILPLVPGIAEVWSALVVSMGLFSVFYGATMALLQFNIRRLLAYTAISQSGMLIIGCITFETTGIEGSIILSQVFGLAMAGLLFSVGFVFERTNTAMIPRLGGLFDSNTALGLLFLVATASTIAMPGTPGFYPANLLIDGVVEKNGWIIALVIGIGNFLAAGFLLWAFQRVFLIAPKHSLYNNKPHHFQNQEGLITIIIFSLLISINYYHSRVVSIVDTATGTIGKFYNLHHSIFEEENSRSYEYEENEITPNETPENQEIPESPPEQFQKPDEGLNNPKKLKSRLAPRAESIDFLPLRHVLEHG